MAGFETGGVPPDPDDNPEQLPDALWQLEQMLETPATPEICEAIRDALYVLSEYGQHRKISQTLLFEPSKGDKVRTRLAVQIERDESGENKGIEVLVWPNGQEDSGRLYYANTPPAAVQDPQNDTEITWELVDNNMPQDYHHGSLLDAAREVGSLPPSVIRLLDFAQGKPAEDNDENFTKIWYALQADADELLHVPRAASWDYHTIINEISHSVTQHDVVTAENGERPTLDGVALWSTVYVAGGFTYYREQNGTDVGHQFEDAAALTDALLPELTEEDRQNHPYVVLPVGFGDLPRENSTAERVGTDRMDGYDIPDDPPMEINDDDDELLLGTNDDDLEVMTHKVIILTGDDQRIARQTWLFPNEEAAQQHADLQYRRDLRNARMSDELTQARAELVLATVIAILEHERRTTA